MGVEITELGKIGITPKGAFDPIVQSGDGYEYLDVVSFNGNGYLSLIAANDQLPTNTEAWMLIVEKGATGDTAYEVAVASGFVGTEAEWIASLQGEDGTPAEISFYVENGILYSQITT